MNASEESGLDPVIVKTSANEEIHGKNPCLGMSLRACARDLGKGERETEKRMDVQ